MKRKRLAVIIAVMLAPVAGILSPVAQSARATMPLTSASPLRTAAVRPGAAAAAVTGCAAGATNDLFFAYSCADAPTWLTYLSERFSVPANPTVSGVTIFFFPSFEDSTQDTILQPVLTWGATPYVSNPNIWYITNYYLWPGNPGVAVSNSVHVGPGDTIDGTIVATSCNSSGYCTWTVESSVEGGAATTPLTVVSGVAMTNVESGAMEVHFANTCAETPSNGHKAFRNLSVDTHNGSWSPAFKIFYPNRQCSVTETAAPSGADILWNP